MEYVLTWLHEHYCIKSSFQPSTRALTSPAGIMLSAERTDRETLGACALTIVRPTKSRFARPTERRTTTNASTNWTCARRKGTLRSRILEAAEVSMLDWYCWCWCYTCWIFASLVKFSVQDEWGIRIAMDGRASEWVTVCQRLGEWVGELVSEYIWVSL